MLSAIRSHLVPGLQYIRRFGNFTMPISNTIPITIFISFLVILFTTLPLEPPPLIIKQCLLMNKRDEVLGEELFVEVRWR